MATAPRRCRRVPVLCHPCTGRTVETIQKEEGETRDKRRAKTPIPTSGESWIDTDDESNDSEEFLDPVDEEEEVLIPEDVQVKEEEEDEDKGPPVVVSRMWKSNRYMVNDKYFGIICSRLGWPVTEVFADQELHRLRYWFGPGSDMPDAFATTWDYPTNGYLWVNPPFDENTITRTINKMLKDGSQGILIVPAWEEKSWYNAVFVHCRKKYFVPEGEELFVTANWESAGPTRWGVWALQIDPEFVNDNPPPHIEEGEVWKDANRAGRRREMKKKNKRRRYQQGE